MKFEREFAIGTNGTYAATTHLNLAGARGHSELLTIENDGENILATNYFDLPSAQLGFFFLVRDAFVDRLLIPDSQLNYIREMKTGLHCVITSGIYREHESIEIMFDDRSSSPFALYLSTNQCLGDARRRSGPSKLAAWTREGKAGEWTAYQRKGKKLPNLQPWV